MPTASERRQQVLSKLRAMASEHGGELLSDRYVNRATLMRWRCSEGHVWETMARNVTRGTWCPRCAGQAKGTMEEMQAIAHGRGGECLSTRYINSSTKLRWRCAEGHEWSALPYSVKRNGTWCPFCSGRAPKTIDDMRELAQTHGGKCLSASYRNSTTKLLWRCAEKHEWWATPGSLKSVGWCPHCAGRRVRLTIDDARATAQQNGGECLSKKYVRDRDPLRWKCGQGHVWKAAYASVRQGTWCPRCAGTMLGTLKEMKAVARARGGECLSTEYVNSVAPLRWRCAEGHEWQATAQAVKNRTWCPQCGGTARRTLEEMKALAEERGGECLSREYENARTKLRWRCAEGHEWRAAPIWLKYQGTWCPYCAGKVKHTLEEMKALALERGGECLSTAYENTRSALRWRCRRGHEWDALPANIIRGTWCSICANERKGLNHRARHAAQRQGGRALVRAESLTDRVRWQCAEGHEFGAQLQRVLNGAWCPKCKRAAKK